jgi:hypothetical protein
MSKWIDRIIGFVIGAAILYASLYIISLNNRVTGIEQYLNKVITAQAQQQAQPKQEIKK